MKKLFLFLFFVSQNSYSLSFDEKLQIDMMLQDKIMEGQIIREIESNRSFQPTPSKPKMKYFGSSSDGVRYSIYLESIRIHKSGTGKFFKELSESKFPRYDGKITYFSSDTGYHLVCEKKEIRKTSVMYFDVNELPIRVSPGKTPDEYFVKKSNSSFEQVSINKTHLENMYMKFICR